MESPFSACLFEPLHLLNRAIKRDQTTPAPLPNALVGPGQHGKFSGAPPGLVFGGFDTPPSKLLFLTIKNTARTFFYAGAPIQNTIPPTQHPMGMTWTNYAAPMKDFRATRCHFRPFWTIYTDFDPV